jgi:hypothetical protein
MATKPKNPTTGDAPNETKPTETKPNEAPEATTETAQAQPATYTVSVPNSRYDAILNGVRFREGKATGVPEPLAKRFERELGYEIDEE